MMSPVGDPPIEFTLTSSLADAMAAETVASRMQVKRSRRVRWVATFAAVFFMTAFLSGIYDNPSDPTAFFRSMMSARMGGMALASFAAIILVMAGMMFGMRTINKALRRKLIKDQRRHHPAVDAGDPALPMTRRFRFDETGMTTSTAFDEVWEGWARVTALDETPDLLILRAGGVLNFPLPKRELSPELRERLQRHVDSRSHSKWPF